MNAVSPRPDPVKTPEEIWEMYQLGQGSADHTAKEVFCDLVEQLTDRITELEHITLEVGIALIELGAVSNPLPDEKALGRFVRRIEKAIEEKPGAEAPGHTQGSQESR